MITKLPESTGNVIGFLIREKLGDEDYKKVLMPAVEEAIGSSQKFRILMQIEKFGGWTAHGAWDDFICWPKFTHCERMAVVVDDNWHEFMSWLFSAYAKVTHIEIKFFKSAQLAEAWAWLKA